MASTRMTAARRTVAVAATALLLVAGCDDGGDQAAAPESPAEQGTEVEGEAPGGAEEETSDAEESTVGEDGSAEGSGDDAEQESGSGEEGDGASGQPIEGDPCADLTAADVGEVLGNEVGDREDEANQGLPEGVDAGSLVSCMYSADTAETPSAMLHWIMPSTDYPEGMPEDLQEEQDANRARGLVSGGESIEVQGADEATVEVTTTAGVTQVTVKAAVGGVALYSSVVAMGGNVDEGDIPTAVELAELAISTA